MNLKVKYAKLHTSYFSNGTGNLSDVLEPQRHTGIKMSLTEVGLFVEFKGIYFMVPLANLVGVTFLENPAEFLAFEQGRPEPQTPGVLAQIANQSGPGTSAGPSVVIKPKA